MSVGRCIHDFPHHLDGGWPEVDPTDTFVTYAQLLPEHTQHPQLSIMNVMSSGGNKTKREQGIALALVVAAATEQPSVITKRILNEQGVPELAQWVAEAEQSLQQLQLDAEAKTTTAGAAAASRVAASVPEVRGRGSGSTGSDELHNLRTENADLKSVLAMLLCRLGEIVAIAMS